MAEKDEAGKALESYNDVFADIVNVLLFDGKQLVREEDLQDGEVHSNYRGKNILHGQERDVAKYWQSANVRIAFIGTENQTDIDPDMSLRVIGYDGAAYRAQLLRDKKERHARADKSKLQPRYPVVTLVLYFGSKPWSRNRALIERLTVPEELKPFVNDYKLNLFDIPRLPLDTVRKFRSDFKFVADYFYQMNRDNNYIPSPDKIKHVRDTMALISALSKDKWYINEYYKMVDEGIDVMGGYVMSEYLQRLRKEGYDDGRNEGRTEGRIEGRIEGRNEGRIEGRNEGRIEGRNEGRIEGRNEGRIEGRNEGRKEGRIEGRMTTLKEGIEAIVTKLNISFEQAADLLKVSDEERKLLRETQKI